MDGARWEILTRVMARMAAGDAAAVFELYESFGNQIAAAVRRLAGPMGASLDAEEVDGLVLDACLALLEAAPSWDPDGGALPWTWAERRLRHVVALHIGIHADPLSDTDGDDLDGERACGAAGGGHDDPVATLLALAGRDPEVAAFAAALTAVASDRDRRVYLEVKLQAVLGDPSPANTVAAMFDMRPAAVRQVVKRVNDRLRSRAA